MRDGITQRQTDHPTATIVDDMTVTMDVLAEDDNTQMQQAHGNSFKSLLILDREETQEFLFSI